MSARYQTQTPQQSVRGLCCSLFCLWMLLQCTAQAQTVACAKNVTGPLLHNGVVVPGVATQSCQVGSVWPQVAPLEMQPPGGSPDGYLYVAHQTAGNRLLIGVDVGDDQDLSDQDSIALVVDADNNASLSSGDFVIQIPVLSVQSPISYDGSNHVACSQAMGTLNYLQFDGTNWQQPSDSDLIQIRAAVIAKLAYRYEVGTKVWNVEIDMPMTSLVIGPKTYFNFTAGGFGLGAYFYVDLGHQQSPQQGTVLRWPSGLVAHDISDPVVGNIIASKDPDFATLAKINLTGTCFDVNFTKVWPWDIGGVAANENDHKVSRTGPTNFGVTFYFKGPGGGTGDLTNHGTVDLELDPYGTSDSGPSYAWVTSQPVTLDHFNQAKRVEFDLNVNTRAQWAAYQPLGFVCATMRLHNFDRNDDTSNDTAHFNYNYFSTSNYTHHFFVFGDDIQNLKPGESGTMLLRLDTGNEVPEAEPHALNRGLSVTVGALFVGFLGLVAFSRGPRRVWLSAGMSLIIGFFTVTFVACPPREGRIGTSRWQVKNANKLGLRPVKGSPGLYQMPIKRGEYKQVDLEFSGVKLPYTQVHQELRPATAEGKPNILRVPVKSGRVVSVLAFGNLRLDGPDGKLPPASAMGMIVGQPPGATGNASPVERDAAVNRSYLLRPGFYAPNEYAGALIGSFDNFETGFVVGRSSSIVIPENANTLSLAVNAELSRYNLISGVYNLVIVDTPAPTVPTHTITQGDATGHVPFTLPPWKVFTSLNVYSYYRTEAVNPSRPPSVTLNQIGAAHYSIYESHLQ